MWSYYKHCTGRLFLLFAPNSADSRAQFFGACMYNVVLLEKTVFGLLSNIFVREKYIFRLNYFRVFGNSDS